MSINVAFLKHVFIVSCLLSVQSLFLHDRKVKLCILSDLPSSLALNLHKKERKKLYVHDHAIFLPTKIIDKRKEKQG